MKLMEQEAAIEAILFASGEAVELDRLAAAIGLDLSTTKALIQKLSDQYEMENRGLHIIQMNQSYQMCTNPKCFEQVRVLYATPKRKTLTQTLMETLAIIAYKQPITKNQIEKIRGVNADHAVHKLMEYGLVQEAGRAETPGKPILFATSDEFLKYFGFKDIQQLPPLTNDLTQLKEEALKEIGNQIHL